MMSSELGYFFHPSEQPDAPGHPQLDVNLYAHPTKAHFDPKQASFVVASPEILVEHVHVVHPWHGRTHFRACAGHVVLQDRNGEVVEAFTLGGELNIESDEDRTVCTLKSSAPIFELVHARTAAVNTLVSEFESLLARRHAAWKGDDAGYEARLTSVEPLALYVSGLAAMKERLERAADELQDEEAALGVIQKEIARLKAVGRWPDKVPVLEKVL
jgi:hypothetical protein